MTVSSPRVEGCRPCSWHAVPRPVDSSEQVEAEFFIDVHPTSPIKRFATPQEVASLVTCVASPLSPAVTGAALRVVGSVVNSAS
ncbi:hypothetical protein BH11PSE8_BH11PSE8_21840 [soil metagenome]